MADRWGHYSGVDWERRFYHYYGLGSVISGGVLTVRDDSIDSSEVEDALNEELIETYAAVADAVPDRFSQYHDFAYPAAVEFLALVAGLPGAPGSVGLPGPYLRLARLYDRSLSSSAPPLQHYPWESFWTMDGIRWSTHGERLYLSDFADRRGPGVAYDLRLEWVALPERIQIASNTVRADIPRQIHEAIAAGAAARVMAVKQTPEEAAKVGAIYARALDKAMRSLTKQTVEPDFVKVTDVAFPD